MYEGCPKSFITLNDLPEVTTSDLTTIMVIDYFFLGLNRTNMQIFVHLLTSIKTHIGKTCPCNVCPLKPHFYIVKLGYAGVYLFFLFLFQNIDCGYSLEPPRRVPTINVLSKHIKTFPQKIFIFYNFKNHCILHGQVFVYVHSCCSGAGLMTLPLIV